MYRNNNNNHFNKNQRIMRELLNITKYKELNEFATLLNNNGFDIISTKSETSYFYFHKDGFFGYCQQYRFDGFLLSTINKPCKKYGTGHNFKKGVDILTIENAQKCLDFCARLIATKDEIKNYLSTHEFMAEKWNVNKLIKTI